MEGRRGRRAGCVALCVCRPAVLLAVTCVFAFALAACALDRRPNMSAAQPRGASVAFDSIDGLPPAQFQTLVRDLNDEAQARRLAVVSRENPSAYRVRGYLAAEVAQAKTTVSWIWDVFDGSQHRALRISGTETADARQSKGWSAVDGAMLRKIAQASMDKLAVFLTSPAVASSPAPAQFTLASMPAASSPEAAGIFRIFHPHADPVPAADASPPPTESDVTATPASVPLPRRRPSPAAAVSGRETLTLAAARRAAP
jgi:hypothetical protein